VNQWPSQRSSFDAALRLYLQHCLRVGQAIMRGE
jgi:isopenicillin N synthase-like dioxygenase